MLKELIELYVFLASLEFAPPVSQLATGPPGSSGASLYRTRPHSKGLCMGQKRKTNRENERAAIK